MVKRISSSLPSLTPYSTNVRALTPINVGEAQVFDTSGIVRNLQGQKQSELQQEALKAHQEQQKAEKDKKTIYDLLKSVPHAGVLPRNQEALSSEMKKLYDVAERNAVVINKGGIEGLAAMREWNEAQQGFHNLVQKDKDERTAYNNVGSVLHSNPNGFTDRSKDNYKRFLSDPTLTIDQLQTEKVVNPEDLAKNIQLKTTGYHLGAIDPTTGTFQSTRITDKAGAVNEVVAASSLPNTQYGIGFSQWSDSQQGKATRNPSISNPFEDKKALNEWGKYVAGMAKQPEPELRSAVGQEGFNFKVGNAANKEPNVFINNTSTKVPITDVSKYSDEEAEKLGLYTRTAGTFNYPVSNVEAYGATEINPFNGSEKPIGKAVKYTISQSSPIWYLTKKPVTIDGKEYGRNTPVPASVIDKYGVSDDYKKELVVAAQKEGSKKTVYLKPTQEVIGAMRSKLTKDEDVRAFDAEIKSIMPDYSFGSSRTSKKDLVSKASSIWGK